jgi:hypothetical protein
MFMKYLLNDHKDTLLRHYMLTTDKLGYNSLDSTCIKLALQYADATGNQFIVGNDIWLEVYSHLYSYMT